MTACTHLSAAELAAMELDGLTADKRAIHMRASREGWAFSERNGRGGMTRLYAVESLPETARADLEARYAKRILAAANDVRRPVGRPKGSDFFTRNPDVADAVEAILSRQKLASTRVYELLQTRFPSLPPLRTLQRHIQQLEASRPALLASTRDPDLFKGKYRISLGRADGGVTRAHQIWELDTTPADVMTKGGRKAILGVIDRWSRRVRFLVAPSESGQSVRRLLIDTITAWGVMPEAVATDNGSGYINQSIVSALEALGIDHHLCPPGSPEKKPFVERVFGTFTRERAELLAGYSGHSVADAQRLRARAKKETGRAEIIGQMEPEELQAVLDAWVDGVYHQRSHGTLRMSPMAKWQSSPAPAAAAPPRDRLILALSAYVGTAIVGKRGVQWKRGRYWSPTLIPFIGRPVIVRRDEEDLGALFIFDEDGRYIDTAVDARRAGLSEEAFAAAATAQQRAWMNEARADLRGKQRAFSFEVARDKLLRQDAERAGKLVSLPRPTVERSTPQLDSFAEPAPAPLPDASVIARAEARFAARQQQTRIQSVPDKVTAADAVLSAHAAGQTVDPADLRRAQSYATHPDYRAHKMIEADFNKEKNA